MPSFEDIKDSEGLVVLAVGHPGSGKTSAILSFASKECPMYVFDIDHRIRGIKGSTDWLGDSVKFFDYDQYDTRDGFKSVEQQFEIFFQQQTKRQFKYKNILIESVGSLGNMFLMDSQSQKGIKPGVDMSKLSEQAKKGARIIGNIAFPTPEDYKYGSRALHVLFYNYFTAFPKCNIFLSGWTTDRWGKDPNSENPYAPDILLPGKKLLATNSIASELPGYFDEVWEFEKEETGQKLNPVKYKVKFNSYIAKTSRPELAKRREIDITGKNFKQELDKILAPVSEVCDKPDQKSQKTEA